MWLQAIQTMKDIRITLQVGGHKDGFPSKVF